MKYQPLTDYWQDVKIKFLTYLENKNLCDDSVRRYKKSLERLLDYVTKNEIQEYSHEIGMNFLQTEENCNYKGKTTIDSRYITIGHLENLLFEKKPKNVRNRLTKTQQPYPNQFAQTIENFLGFLKCSNYRETTITKYRASSLKMLWDFDKQGIKDWGEIKADNLSIAFSRSTDKTQFYFHAKKLFKFLVEENVIMHNYSGILPKMFIKNGIPSVYSNDEINILLKSINRTSSEGKRNYAIILLGVKLGLRASDIRFLRFDNVDFKNSVISFVQHKTCVPQKLLLVKEVDNALCDYINNGRGKTDEPYIFLDTFGRPLTATSIPSIVQECFRKSGINFGIRKHGSHALRMTFASNLIKENVPYDVVRTLLGHINRDSTKQYVQLAIENLRICALEVPAPTGMFEKYLNGEIR